MASRKLGVIRARVGRIARAAEAVRSRLVCRQPLLFSSFHRNQTQCWQERGLFPPKKIKCSWKARHGSSFSSFLNSRVPFLHFSGSPSVLDYWYLHAGLNSSPFLNHKPYESRIFYLLPQYPNGPGQSLVYIWCSISNE